MRKKLSLSEGSRKRYKAIFARLGKKTNYHGYREDTILLKTIVDVETGEVVADHLWFNFTKAFEKVILTEGAGIEFEARVKEYTKGYVNLRHGIENKKKDFKLSHPTKIKLI